MNEIKYRGDVQPSAATGPRRLMLRLLDFGRWLIEPERLPKSEERPSRRLTASGPLSWIAPTDRLPNRADAQRDQQHLLSWLASLDELPTLPSPPRPRRGVVRRLIEREQLPTMTSDAHSTPRSFFRWLLTTDPHERLESHPSTKEVALHEP
jgi:hypothetical protein